MNKVFKMIESCQQAPMDKMSFARLKENYRDENEVIDIINAQQRMLGKEHTAVKAEYDGEEGGYIVKFNDGQEDIYTTGGLDALIKQLGLPDDSGEDNESIRKIKEAYVVTRKGTISVGGKDYAIAAELTVHDDPDYGADADGNRGETHKSVEDVSVQSLVDTETGEDIMPKLNSMPEMGNAIDRWVEDQDLRADESQRAVRKQKIKEEENRAKLDGVLRLYRDVDSDNVHSEIGFSIRTVQDEEFLKEVEQLLNKYAYPNTTPGVERFDESKQAVREVKFVVWDKKNHKLKAKTDGGVLEFDNQAAARKHVEDVLGEPARYELLARTNTSAVRHEAMAGSVKEEAANGPTDAEEKEYVIPTGNAQLVYGIKGVAGEQFEVKQEKTMLPMGKYEVVGKENSQSIVGKEFSELRVKAVASADESRKRPVSESTNLDLYKKLINIFGDFADNHPGSGIGKIYRALLATGLKAVPKDKQAQAILSSFVSGLLVSASGSVHDMLNKNYTDLPLDIKPVYKDGNKRLVPFWCKGDTLCSKVVDLLSLGEEPAGKWTDEQRQSVKLDDAHIQE